jgi:hypothetical protein
MQETVQISPEPAVLRHLVQGSDGTPCRAVACIHLMQGLGPAAGIRPASVGDLALDEPAETALADEDAVADDGLATDEDGANAATHG